MKLKRLAIGCVALFLLIPAAIATRDLMQGSGPPWFTLGGLMLGFFSLGAALLFMLGQRGFRDELKRAYKLIYIGMAAYGIGQLLLSIILLLEVNIIGSSGMIALPYIIALVMIFAGIRRFAHIINFRTKALTWKIMLLSSTGGAAVALGTAIIMPHQPMEFPVIAYYISQALNGWALVVLILSVNGLRGIQALIAPRYQSSLQWLAVGLIALAISASSFIIIMMTLPITYWPLNTIPSLIAAILFMMAGYKFIQIIDQTVEFTSSVTAVDVVVFAASLASVPREIDPLLNRLREVTASTGGSTKLSSQQEDSLITLYLSLEDYLVHQEPLRQFTVAGLRESVRTRFQINPEANPRLVKLFVNS